MAQFKVGDRVRFTGEGEVAAVSDNLGCESIRLVGWSNVLDLSPWNNRYTVEKIASPLPATTGSVIRNRHSGAVWYLGHWGEWKPVNRSLTGGDTAGIGVPENYDVIFDAGKDA